MALNDQRSNIVFLEGAVRRYDGHALKLSLRDKESIERVGVMLRQREHTIGMRRGDRKLLNLRLPKTIG